MYKSMHKHKPLELRLLALWANLNTGESFQRYLLAVTSASHCFSAISDRPHHPAAFFCQKQQVYLAENLPNKFTWRKIFLTSIYKLLFCINSLNWRHCSTLNPIRTNNIQINLTGTYHPSLIFLQVAVFYLSQYFTPSWQVSYMSTSLYAAWFLLSAHTCFIFPLLPSFLFLLHR